MNISRTDMVAGMQEIVLELYEPKELGLIMLAHCRHMDFLQQRNLYCELLNKLHTRLLSQKKSHRVGKELIKHCALEMAKIVLVKEA